jgi:hypothetical protein
VASYFEIEQPRVLTQRVGVIDAAKQHLGSKPSGEFVSRQKSLFLANSRAGNLVYYGGRVVETGEREREARARHIGLYRKASRKQEQSQ